MKQIPLTRGMTALVDDEDFEVLMKYRWYANVQGKKFRAVCCQSNGRKNSKSIYMHRIVLGVSDPKISVDHIDGNPLNNQRSNLRLCNASQNGCNRGADYNNKSGFKGVYFLERTKRWRARIWINGMRLNLGYFSTKSEAAIAYNLAAVNLHGEFSRLNEI